MDDWFFTMMSRSISRKRNIRGFYSIHCHCEDRLPILLFYLFLILKLNKSFAAYSENFVHILHAQAYHTQT